MDLMVTDESPSQISDKIKEILYAKSAERIDAARPNIAASTFTQNEPSESEEEEITYTDEE